VWSSAVEVAAAARTLADLRILGLELQRLLAVVVLDRHGLVDATRRAGTGALVGLLAELRIQALPSARAELKRLHSHVQQALPRLVAFVAPLERVEQELVGVLGTAGLGLATAGGDRDAAGAVGDWAATRVAGGGAGAAARLGDCRAGE
jgi:hypothetical protein